MKIIYILPNGTVKSGGNWVTVVRLAEGFKKRKIDVDIIEAKDATTEKLMKYDVIHAFHAFKSLAKISHLISNVNKTVIVSFTGTDIEQLQEIKENKHETINLLNKTQSIIVFHSEAREQLIKEGVFSENIKVVPQASMPIYKKDKEVDQSVRQVGTGDCITFLFAAGIRKVKAPLKVIEMMSSLVKKVPNVRLVMIGPILDNDLGKEVKKRMKDKKWAKYLGEVSHREAQDFILKSDIVLNASVSEGMANTLLEAQQMGKPILATDIAGNRATVTHGVNGYLFKDSEEFEYYARKLSENLSLREKMGKAGLEVRRNYDWDEEINIYEKVYKINNI